MDSQQQEDEEIEILSSSISSPLHPTPSVNDVLHPTDAVEGELLRGHEGDESEVAMLLPQRGGLTQIDQNSRSKRKADDMVASSSTSMQTDLATNTSTAVLTASSEIASSMPLTPPDWDEMYHKTITSLTLNCLPFAVGDSSLEYRTIVDLMKPFTVVKITKIVNTSLWESYENQKKEMVKKMANRLDVLLELGMGEVQAKTRARRAKYFQKDPLLSTPEGSYSLNEALLFHCTSTLQNVDDILEQGLDERLASGGILGNGIYFADDPRKAGQYASNTRIMLLFTVLLGDCKDFGVGGDDAADLRREPKKGHQERRSLDDKFFDSITARSMGSRYNEYVIFNGRQCYPLYEIEYMDNNTTFTALEAVHQNVPECYSTARKTSPNFTWKAFVHSQSSFSNVSSEQYFMPNQQQTPSWPFFASTVFKKMSAEKSTTTLSSLNLRPETSAGLEESHDEFQEPSQPRKKTKLTTTPTTTSAPATAMLNQTECPLCAEIIIVVSASTWKKLSCDHEFCTICYEKIKCKGTTIGGVEHISAQCPFCNKIEGVKVGNCCSGEMIIKSESTSCEGYDEYPTITINYIIDHDRYQLDRMAYLPDNEKGRRVVELLKIAWDRRLIFSIGESLTTGATDTLVWNVHHKTSQNGGVSAYGYPDPSYLDRVLEELRANGIY